MRPIHVARLDKARPVLILTRQLVRPYLTRVTVAPITSTARGLSTELPVGQRNGLDHDSVVSLDNVVTVPSAAIGEQIGMLLDEQEQQLTEAILLAFDLTDPDRSDSSAPRLNHVGGAWNAQRGAQRRTDSQGI